MTSAHSTPYVSLEEFPEMEPAEGAWLEWSGGLVYSDIAEAGQTIRIHGHDVAVDAIYGPAG